MSRSSIVYCLRRVGGAAPWSAAVVVAAGLLLCLMPALNVALVAQVVDKVNAAVAKAPGASAGEAMFSVVMLIGVLLLGHVLTVASSYGLGAVQLRVENVLARDIVETACTGRLQDFESAAYQNRLSLARDGARFRVFSMFADLHETSKGALSLIGLSTLLISWDAVVGLCILLSPVPAVLANVFYGRVGWQIDQRQTEPRRMADYISGLITAPQHAGEVLAHAAGPGLSRRYLTIKRGILLTDLRVLRSRSLVTGGLGALSVFGIGFAFLSATQAALNGGSVGMFAGFLTGATSVQAVAQGLYRSACGAFENALYMGNVATFIGSRRQGAEGSRHAGAELHQGVPLAFEGVSFTYEGSSAPALHDVSFTLEAGETLFVVGENGSGKSSLAKLACGLYLPASGSVHVYGNPVDAYSRSELSACIATVFQNPIRYEGSLSENIYFGAEDAIGAHGVVSVLSKVGMRDRFDDASGAGDVPLGKLFAGGRQLSGGEWQRIALARAIVKSGHLLIADEPSTFLDVEGLAGMNGLLLGNGLFEASLIVTHDLAGIPDDARVLVLHEGRVVESGTCRSLASHDGVFARIRAAQQVGEAVRSR